MLHKIYRISVYTLTHLKKISIKRLFILSLLFLFIAGFSFFSVLISTKESIAYAPMEVGSLSDILKNKGQHLEAVFEDRFTGLSARDKELAYIYLRKKFRGRNVSYTLHTVQDGENFWGIAKEYGVNVDTIIGANPELEDLLARKGRQLIVMSKCGVLHEVRDKDETLEMISKLYDVPMEKIYKYNDIKNDKIQLGDVLFMRRAKPMYMSESLRDLFNKRRLFRSPISGVYTSVFGTRIHPVTGEKDFHEGVDIRAKMGTWVGAAADGRVVFSGWSGNLGYCVKIKHKNGFVSLYGHLSKLYVKSGQRVKAGKLIAKTGKSGRTTGPHLHFAIFKNGRAKDPLKYLW